MTQPGRIEMREVPAPRPGPGEALLRIRRIGICGIGHPRLARQAPVHPIPRRARARVQRHGGGGRTGSDGHPPGMKATARPQIVCGQCPPCRRGEYNVCKRAQGPGISGARLRPGTFRGSPEPPGPAAGRHELRQRGARRTRGRGRARHRPGRRSARAQTWWSWAPHDRQSGGSSRALPRGRKRVSSPTSTPSASVWRGLRHRPRLQYPRKPLAEIRQATFGDGGSTWPSKHPAQRRPWTMPCGMSARAAASWPWGLRTEPRVDVSLLGDRELALIGTLMYKHGDYEQAVRLDRRRRTSSPSR